MTDEELIAPKISTAAIEMLALECDDEAREWASMQLEPMFERIAASLRALAAERDAHAAEIERLAKDKRWIIDERDRTFALMLSRAEKAEAEIERLRAKLAASEKYRDALIDAAEQRGYASAMEAERKLHEAHIEAQAAEIERLNTQCEGLFQAAINNGQALIIAEAKLAKAVEAAFYEGFCEGRDGGWVWGDPTPAWKKSDAFAELTGGKNE